MRWPSALETHLLGRVNLDREVFPYDVPGVERLMFSTAVSKSATASAGVPERNLPPIVDKVTETSPYC